MKDLLKFSFVLFVGAMMFAACSDDSESIPEQSEVIVEPFLVTDKTLTVQCMYRPDKSVAYQLQIGNAVSEKYSKGKFLKILNLSPDHEYTLKAIIYDANQKAIGMSEISFKTTKTDSSYDMVSYPQAIKFEEQDQEN